MKRLALLTGATAAMIGLAVPAYADPGGPDADFLGALSAAGLSHGGPAKAIAAGRAVCQLMESGLSPVDTVVAVQSTNPGFTLEHAAQFAVISANAYCPEQV